MSATVSATLVTTGKPVELTKPDGRLGPGDTVEVKGSLAVKLESGLAVLQINVQSCEMRLPIAPKPKAAKPGSCGRGTPIWPRSKAWPRPTPNGANEISVDWPSDRRE
jgi:hypothetical protein